MNENKSNFTIIQWIGYVFIFSMIVLSFAGIADRIAISLMSETQQSTATYALLLKTVASGLTFIPDNDALAPYIDTFDRAGTLLFIASITITLQKVALTLLQTPMLSFLMLGMLFLTIINKLSRVFDNSFTIAVRKYLIILLIVRFFLTASSLVIYGGIGVLLDSNEANNAKRTELLNFNIKQITDSKDTIDKENIRLQKEINLLENKVTLNRRKMESIGTKWIGNEDSRVVSLREKNKILNQQIDILEDQQVSGYGLTSNVKIAMANITAWFKDISEGIFTTVSIFLLKIVIFPLITYLMAYSFGRSILGKDSYSIIENSFKKK